MMNQKTHKLFFLLSIVTFLSSCFTWESSYAQTVVGMGTDSPNPHAVLELVAQDKNQGLLVPRLSDNSLAALANQLTTQDQGLLVFAQDQGAFCYWWGNQWRVLRAPDHEDTKYVAGNGIVIEEESIQNTGDLDSTNELQSLGSVLRISHDADQQRITNVANPIDEQDVATRAFVSQQLSTLAAPSLRYDEAAKVLSLSGSDSVHLGTLNTDEQDLSLAGNTLSLTNDSSPINLSATTPSNGQTLSWNASLNRWEAQSQTTSYSAGTGITINGSNQITNTAPDQHIGLTGNGSVTVSGTYPTFTISGTDLVDDADNDANNETITSASLETGDVLRITESGTNHDVDLSSFQKKTLSAGQVLVGNASNVASPVNISGDITLNSDGTMTINLDAVTTAKILNQAVTTAKLADDAVTKEKINADVAGNGLSQATDGSLETANTASGEILIGQGSGAAAQVVSGDIALAADGSTTVEGLTGRPISSTNPSSGQVLSWNGTSWEPATVSSGTLGWGHWFKGTSVPTITNPITAVNGDFYLKTDEQIAYYKEGGVWTELGGFNQVDPVSEINGKADSYRTPVLYLGDDKPVEGDDIGTVGDFYYSRTEEKLYYRFLDVSNGKTKWQAM